MKVSGGSWGLVKGFHSLIFVAGLLLGSVASHAESVAPDTGISVASDPAVSAEAQRREAWHAAMSQTPLPSKGCFKSVYPNSGWQRVPCATPPPKPQGPRTGTKSETVGNGNDLSAQAPAGVISRAVGSFVSVNGVTSITDPGGQSNFALQLNTNFFTNTSNNVPACSGAAKPTQCVGWEQFIYSNTGSAFIQYWLINFVNSCPSGWASSGSNCYRNSANAASLSVQGVDNLAKLVLTGAVSATNDSVSLFDGTTLHSATGDNLVNLVANWQIAEFNIVGDCCSSQTNFNGGSTVVVRTRIAYGNNIPPLCAAQGFTAETNNLNYGLRPRPSGPGPSIMFEESSAGKEPSNCLAATNLGVTLIRAIPAYQYLLQQ